MIFKNIFLAFQLENYDYKRFIKFIYRHPKFWFSGSERQQITWTSKAKILFLGGILLCIIDGIAGVYLIETLFKTPEKYILYIVFSILYFFSLPLYFIVVNILLFPVDLFLKKRIISQAKKKIGAYNNLTVIGITGSYGKTTTKEILATLLSPHKKVLTTEGNKNTPLGVSEKILKELDDTYDVFIVEMGAYTKGNIQELCELVGPDISILTGITLQHLERFGNLDAIIDAKFEILEALGENGTAIVDITTEGVKKGLASKKFSTKNIITISPLDTNNYFYKENLEGIGFEINGKKYETQLIAPYIINILKIGIEVGKIFGISEEKIAESIQHISFVPHRMQVIKNPANNVTIIDDSYNGNIEGIESIRDVFTKAPISGRRIAILGGVVELGNELEAVHQDIGKRFSRVCEKVLLVRGVIGENIEKGLLSSGFKKEDIMMYDTPLQLHEDLKHIIQPGDVVVFQNDLPDQYL